MGIINSDKATMARGKKTGGKDWKPGQSGNPKGAPIKDFSLTNAMKEWLAKGQNKQKIVEEVGKRALKGDIYCIKMIWGYMDGTPKQTIEHEGTIDIPPTSIIIDGKIVEKEK
jgi:hypothetical protein